MQVALGSWTMQIMICEWVNMVYLVSCIIEYRNIVPYIKSRIIPYHPRQVAMWEPGPRRSNFVSGPQWIPYPILSNSIIYDPT